MKDKEEKLFKPSECEPGKWYQHEQWGRVLCCGAGDLNEWLPAFAIRTEKKRTELRFLSDDRALLTECDQSWQELKGGE